MRAVTPNLTEDQLIRAITQALGEPPRRLRVGIGDDAAVWKARGSHLSLITTDALVDGVHFRLATTSPQALGHKALAQNLSDIAAMGGLPTLAVVALGVTDVVDEAWARSFYGGMAQLAKRCACAIAGGDIVRAPALSIAVTVVGEVRKTNLRLRSGAEPGDYACVTGPLGLAAAALKLNDLQSSQGQRSNGPLGPLSPSNAALLRAAYETPTPRLPEGKYLASCRATHALMDISDGLSLDVARMARASGVDVCLDVAALQPHLALVEFIRAYNDEPRSNEPSRSGKPCSNGPSRSDESCSNGPLGPLNAVGVMLYGGDDYELLAAIEPRAYSHVARRFKARFKRELTVVGRFEEGSGNVWLLEGGKRSAHVPGGYDHLAT